MKAKLTPQAAQAFTNLQAKRDFLVAQEWMSDIVAGWNQALIMSDNSEQRAVLTGMCRGMSLLFSSMEAAPQVLESMKQNHE